jgi:hypothetical protein
MTVILGRWLSRHALLAAVEDMVPRNDSPPDRRREGTPATSSRAGLSLDSLAPLSRSGAKTPTRWCSSSPRPERPTVSTSYTASPGLD